MQKLHIVATVPAPIGIRTQKFAVSYPKYGGGTIQLTSLGEYTLTTTGITDGSARRTPEYKIAYYKVSMAMLQAYESENRLYTSMHQDMLEVKDRRAYEKELVSLTPQKYQRSTFSLAKPTESEVEKDLEHEYKALNFDKNNKKFSGSVSDFVGQKLGSLMEERQRRWQEAYDLFATLEDAREARENARFFAAYKSLYNQKQNYIQGTESEVKAALSSLCATIRIPFPVCLSCHYTQHTHQLDVEMVFEEGVPVPLSKATMLASRKISIKNKSVKEIIADTALSTLSCIYYLTSHLFSVSPNIKYVRLSVYNRTQQNPLLWVEFDRTVFARLKPQTVDLYADILGYPHILNFKAKGDALELTPINASTFEKEVMIKSNELNASRPSVHPSLKDL